MLSVAEAQSLVLQTATPFEPQSVRLDEAFGLGLAADVIADGESPPFDKSLVDGFAVRLVDGSTSRPIIEVVLAGEVPQRAIVDAAAVQIMTGAPLPDGADVVVPIELAVIDAGTPSRVRFTVDVLSWKSGTNIVRRGASTRRGDLVVAAGTELLPQQLGALAEWGCAAVPVRRAPRVAVLATGDELVPIEQAPGPGQIRNSNELMLAAQIRRAGGQPIPLGIARDERAHLASRIAEGLRADVLVLSGGVSMGERDLVPAELTAAGVRQVFHKVNVKPGKPVWFGIRDETTRPCLVFGLPGNPVSSMVCFELFVRPALRGLMGIHPAEPRHMRARLAQAHTTKGDRPTYHPSRLEWHPDGLTVRALPWVGSSDLRATVAADSMTLFPLGDHHYPVGTMLDVIPW